MNLNEDVKLAEKILLTKIEIFSQYEKITDEMLNCETEELLSCVGKRQDLALEIDALDQRLSTLYLESGQQGLKQASLNEMSWGECPENLKDVFLNGQNLACIISRILRKEQQVFSHVETKKEMLIKLIKQQNTGSTANVAKYYSTSKHNENNFTHFNNKY